MSADAKNRDDVIRVDVAVIGGGLAGLCAALSLDPSLSVGIFAKRARSGGASEWAQGGIAAAVGADDSPHLHAEDTLAAGGGLCDPEVVAAVTRVAPAAVDWLVAQGAQFAREADGALRLAREGGHSRRRVVNAADATGKMLVSTLRAQAAARANIRLFADFAAIDFIADGKGESASCLGFYALDAARDRVCAVAARAVVVASGGAGKAYLYTTNPDDATGDGIAAAFRARCRVANLEFVQFHPTCLYHPHAGSFLISEAARGEGGKIVDGDGRRFLPSYHPDAELAPRDIVARAIDAEMKKSGANCVYLDLTARDESFLRERFPTIREKCARLGIDIAKRPIPVVPAAHYFCGGVVTDSNARADLRNLFVAGEAACAGLHGANRLASNSLLECVTAARAAAAAINQDPPPPPPAPPPWNDRLVRRPPETVTIAHDWEETRRLMWNYVGIMRSDERLLRARRRLQVIQEEIDDFYRRFRVSADFLELRNLALVARLIVEGALSRRENRGLHFNADCEAASGDGRSTIFARADFARLRRCVNAACPFSGRPPLANSLLEWRGQIVGFCNPGCRDKFAAAAAAGFAAANEEIIAARDKLLRAPPPRSNP